MHVFITLTSKTSACVFLPSRFWNVKSRFWNFQKKRFPSTAYYWSGYRKRETINALKMQTVMLFRSVTESFLSTPKQLRPFDSSHRWSVCRPMCHHTLALPWRVFRRRSKSMEKAKIRPLATPKPLNRSSQKLAGVITSWTAPGMPKFCSDRFRGFCSPNPKYVILPCFWGD